MYLHDTLLVSVPWVLALASIVSAAPQASNVEAVNTTTCNGKQYVYEELAGYGYLPSNARDNTGDTIGGIGSSIAMDKSSWRREGKSYKGLLYTLPDRGWNTEGTLKYQNRIQKIEVTFTPDESATVANPSGPNIDLKYLDTILLTDPKGTGTCGLDAGINGPYIKFSSIPFELPSVNYTGNGFGGKGNGGTCVTIDSEGIFLGSDGTFWISDEYGPYVYHFDKKGRMIGAIRPPDALIPRRNGSESFSADSPPIYAPNLEPIPEDNPTGRNNNQGFGPDNQSGWHQTLCAAPVRNEPRRWTYGLRQPQFPLPDLRHHNLTTNIRSGVRCATKPCPARQFKQRRSRPERDPLRQ